MPLSKSGNGTPTLRSSPSVTAERALRGEGGGVWANMRLLCVCVSVCVSVSVSDILCFCDIFLCVYLCECAYKCA